MSNRTDKPMLSSAQLVEKMRDEKGITFSQQNELIISNYKFICKVVYGFFPESK